jgi:hypothetical protein
MTKKAQVKNYVSSLHAIHNAVNAAGKKQVGKIERNLITFKSEPWVRGKVRLTTYYSSKTVTSQILPPKQVEVEKKKWIAGEYDQELGNMILYIAQGVV